MPGLTGSQYFALLAATENRGSTTMIGMRRSTALREFLHLRVVHVLAEVRADEHQAIGVLDVGGLGRAEAGAEGEREADVARARGTARTTGRRS